MVRRTWLPTTITAVVFCLVGLGLQLAVAGIFHPGPGVASHPSQAGSALIPVQGNQAGLDGDQPAGPQQRTRGLVLAPDLRDVLVPVKPTVRHVRRSS